MSGKDSSWLGEGQVTDMEELEPLIKSLSPALTRWDTEVALRGAGVHSAYTAWKKVWICRSSISTEFSYKLLHQFIYKVFKTTTEKS